MPVVHCDPTWTGLVTVRAQDTHIEVNIVLGYIGKVPCS